MFIYTTAIKNITTILKIKFIKVLAFFNGFLYSSIAIKINDNVYENKTPKYSFSLQIYEGNCTSFIIPKTIKIICVMVAKQKTLNIYFFKFSADKLHGWGILLLISLGRVVNQI